MRPLFPLCASGAQTDQVIQELTNIANRGFSGLDFFLVNTVIYFAPASPMAPQSMIAHVAMIFSAGSSDEIKKFMERTATDPELSQVFKSAPGLQVVK
jgi:hypothetical protein